MLRGQRQSNVSVGEKFSQITICGMSLWTEVSCLLPFFPTLQGSAAVFSAVGLKRSLHLATQHGNRGTGVFSLSPAASEPNSEGSVKSGEKAANRWTQLRWQTGMSSTCYSVKMERSHIPQSHPSMLVTADNFVSKQRRLPWFAPSHAQKRKCLPPLSWETAPLCWNNLIICHLASLSSRYTLSLNVLIWFQREAVTNSRVGTKADICDWLQVIISTW